MHNVKTSCMSFHASQTLIGMLQQGVSDSDDYDCFVLLARSSQAKLTYCAQNHVLRQL